MGKFFETHKKGLVVALSGVVLLVSGISLGMGISQLSLPQPQFESQGLTSDLSSVGSEEPVPSGPININTASVGELEALPGIGPSKAATIVSYREENGPFKNISDIQNVSGIGPATFARIKDQITVK